MAESQEDLEEHTHRSVIRGHHIYKDIWSSYIGEHLTLQRKDSNTHDRHAVCWMYVYTVRNLYIIMQLALYICALRKR